MIMEALSHVGTFLVGIWLGDYLAYRGLRRTSDGLGQRAEELQAEIDSLWRRLPAASDAQEVAKRREGGRR